MDDAGLFLVQHGTIVLFVMVFIEQIGIPLPAVPLLIGAGALAGSGHLNLWTALGTTFVAALAADWVWYELGRRRGRGVLGWLCRIALEPDSCVQRTEVFFKQHGPYSLVMAKFIPGLSTIAPPLAGVVGLSLPRFVLYDVLGTVLWAGSSVGIGYAFSDQLEQGMAYGQGLAPAMAVVLAIGGLAYIFGKAMSRRRELRQVPRTTVGDLRERMTDEVPPLLVDVRTAGELAAKPKVPGAHHIPVAELSRRHVELPRDRDLVLYCDCPNDAASAQGTLLLYKAGFTRVWVLVGGLDAWNVAQSDDTEGRLPLVGPLSTHVRRTRHGAIGPPVPRRQCASTNTRRSEHGCIT